VFSTPNFQFAAMLACEKLTSIRMNESAHLLITTGKLLTKPTNNSAIVVPFFFCLQAAL
jgi:hypothetical protein